MWSGLRNKLKITYRFISVNPDIGELVASGADALIDCSVFITFALFLEFL